MTTVRDDESVDPSAPHIPAAEAPSPAASAKPADTNVVATQQPFTIPVLTTPSPTVDSPPEQLVDPKIAPLIAIFPSFDHAILADILESCNGNEDQAVDILLGMSDPDHVTSHAPPSTTELDEALAHRLMIEEQEQETLRYQQQHQGANLPYIPRARTPTRRSHEYQQQDASLQEQFRDFISPARRTNNPSSANQSSGSDFQEQFNKLADTGKKTFSSFVSKVKAKIQEFDQSGPSQSTPPTQTPEQPIWTGHQPPVTQSSSGTYSEPPPQPYSRQGGYDLTPNSVIASPQPIPNPTSNLGSGFLSRTNTSPPPSASPPAAANVDRSKLGLLPKRPVSLVASPPPLESSRRDDPFEDDDLFVDNPNVPSRK